MLLLVLAALPLSANQADSGSFVRFGSLTIEDGLAQNSVNAVHQDRRGFLWLATEEGLHRYDGYEFVVYRHKSANDNSLSDSYVLKLAEGPDGDIWAGTYIGGLNRVDPLTGVVQRFEVLGREPGEDGSYHDRILSLYVDRAGGVWAGTRSGLVHRPRGQSHFSEVALASGQREAVAPINAVAELEDGSILVGAANGLFVIDPGSSMVLPTAHRALMEDWGEHEVHSISPGWAPGELWIAGSTRLMRRDPDSRTTLLGRDFLPDITLPRGAIYRVVAERPDVIWFGVYGHGLWRVEPERDNFRVFSHDPVAQHGLAEDLIQDLHIDRSGMLWLGTKWRGAQFLNPRALAFGHISHHPLNENSLPDSVVWALEPGSTGNIWAGTENGLASVNPDTQEVTRIEFAADSPATERATTRFITAVHESPADGSLWAGSVAGLWHRPPGEKRLHWVDLETPLGEMRGRPGWMPVVGFVETDDGTLWIARLDGLARLDPADATWSWVHGGPDGERGPLPPGDLRDLIPHPDGRFWITGERGTVLYDPERGLADYRITDQPDADIALERAWAMGMVGIDEEIVWLASPVGLYRIDQRTEQGRIVGESEGLPETPIYGLERAHDGQLWLSTSQGLIRLDPETGEVLRFDVQDGLQSNEFNAGASLALPDGRLVFGGIDGLNLFDPAEVIQSAPAPIVTLTNLAVLGESVDPHRLHSGASSLRFGHQDTALTFEFALSDFSSPERNRFEYMLSGFDQQWHSSGNYNRTTYTNLPPGNYTFRVRGANRFGVWSPQAASLAITMLPPFWRTWWAYLTYALLTAVLAVTGWSLLVRRWRREDALRNERDRRHWSEILQNLTVRMAGSLESESIMDQLHEGLASVMEIHCLVIIETGDSGIETIHMRNTQPDAIAQETRLETLHGIVETNRQANSAAALDPDMLKPLQLEGLTQPAGVLIPLRINGADSGFLIAIRKWRTFNGQETGLLAAAGTQALVSVEKARLFARVQQLAITDELTGLYTRRHLDTVIDRELERGSRFGRETALMIMDIDHFKLVNDHHGHQIGDACLVLVAHAIRDNLRMTDVLCRYGGEEFVALLPETGAAEARLVAERIRRAVKACARPQSSMKPLTISIGIAVAGDDDIGPEKLLESADAALYTAKRQGRDRVEVDGRDCSKTALPA